MSTRSHDRRMTALAANKALAAQEMVSLKREDMHNKAHAERMKLDEQRSQAIDANNNRMEVAKRQDEEKMNRERFKAEQEKEKRNTELQVRLEQARLEARKEVELSSLGHSHRMTEKDKDLQSEITLRNGQYSFEIKKEKEQRKTKLVVQEAHHRQSLEIQRNQYDQEIKIQDKQHHQEIKLQEEKHHLEKDMKAFEYEHEGALEALKQQHFLRQEDEKRQTYQFNSAVDVQAHKDIEEVNTKEYRERSRIDMEKAAGDSLQYMYRANVDAKLKVWVMEQELRIFGRRASDDEISEYVKKNKDKWESEIDPKK